LKGAKFKVKGKNGTYAPAVGPFRMTVVLGGFVEGAAGRCAQHTFSAPNCVTGRHELGIVFGSSAGYDLPSGDMLEPDASYISGERFAAHPPNRPDEFLRVVPNLVVEILSPATAKRDRTEKKALYEANGVDEYWIVNGRHRTVTVFSLGPHGYDAGRTVMAGSLRSSVLPKLRVPVAKLFEQ